MPVQKNNVIMHGTSGSFSRLITFKQYNGRTVVTRYPDMSRVVYTKAQIEERFRFKLAVAYARAVIADPVRKKAYSGKKHFSAYHAAIAEYITNSKAEEKQKASPAVEIPLSKPAIKTEVPLTFPLTTTEGTFDPTSTENPPS